MALLVLAYERLESPWAISLVLLADFLPSMFLGPIFGAAADRWSRRWCAATADLARALAFVSLAFFDGFAVTVALGAARGRRYRPLPAGRDGRPAEPRLAGGAARRDLALRRAGRCRLHARTGARRPRAAAGERGDRHARERPQLRRLGRRADAGSARRRRPARGVASLVREARAGVRAVARMPGVRAVIAGSSAVVLFAGLFNVGELLLAEDELGAGHAGFAMLVAMFGLGVVAGSLAGAGNSEPLVLKRAVPARLGRHRRRLSCAAASPGHRHWPRSGSPWPASATGSSSCTSGCSCR